MNTLPVTRVLPFLGQRAYLHGTTLFDAMLVHVPAGSTISFRIPQRIDSDTVRLQTLEDSGQTGLATLAWKCGDRSGTICAVPLPGSTRPRRDVYDEGSIRRQLSSNAGEVTLDTPTPLSFVATLIPLFKALLDQDPRPASPGQWVFSRLDFGYPPTPFLPVRLRLDARIGGRLARAAVTAGAECVGHLYFSWASPV